MLKRFCIAIVLLAFAVSSLSAVPPRKQKQPCAPSLARCPVTGCGGAGIDTNLNRRKNIQTAPAGAAKDMTIAQMKELDDPVSGYVKGGKRDVLKAMGEGRLIRVVALALIVRPGHPESCNCGLGGVADSDNHIVLIDPDDGSPSLTADEPKSITAEFTPRVRKRLPELSRATLKPLIDNAPKNALRVRVTGVLMFDSEHSLGRPLTRSNNWEIHPVFMMEYCPTGKKCPNKGTANWKQIGQ